MRILVLTMKALFLYILVVLSISSCRKAEKPEHEQEFGECGTVATFTGGGTGLKSSAEIENRVDERMAYFISQFGSEENFEKFYGKTVSEIRMEYFQLFSDSLKEK